MYCGQVAAMLVYYTLSCGRHPFGKTEAQISLNLTKRCPIMDPVNPESDTLIYALLCYNSDTRPTANQTLK